MKMKTSEELIKRSNEFVLKKEMFQEKEEENEKKDLKKEKSQFKKEKTDFFYPKEKDSLFWCFYIIKYGFSKYEMPETTSFVNEKKEKFECIEFLRTCKQQLKTKKIKNIREDVEYDLANSSSINMKTFIALCIANNVNIMFIENRKCFELVFDEGSPVHVVHNFKHFSSTRAAYESDVTLERLEEYRNTLFKWDSVEKPLKAISAYTVDDLTNICKRFDLSDLKKKTKKELYELILTKL
jgi:hypothetical protein